jgi:hypothetical protein
MEFSSAISMEKYATNRSLMHSIRFLLHYSFFPAGRLTIIYVGGACVIELLIVGESARAGKRLRDKFARVLHGTLSPS